MNAVEIEAAVAELVSQPFDRDEFPFALLQAFGNKATTIARLRKGATNKSDVTGGVLQRNNIHVAVCDAGQVGATLVALRASPETGKAKAKFIFATDGDTLEAEDLASGETIAADYADLAEHFGFFLALAGISTLREIADNPIDVRATGRLNKLYVEILKHNPEWAGDERRHDMNHFMARLIFCFFAEDTDIFEGEDLFTRTIDQMTERDGGNLHEVMATLFRAMDIKREARTKAGLPNWALPFPYVNGSLFSGATEVPRFSKLARSYLIHAGNLDWKAINPDIFGSMIQAVANDDERGELGMHYTSVPNILKVLNPLFLDELRQQLIEAGDNTRKLLNLRKRMARIRVFDPACGSGNFLVIAYREMRGIEAEINQRRREREQRSEIPLTNFRGIELRDFAAEIARLALVIAEYQCDVRYRGQKEALREFLPLSSDNWITCGNALRLDWLAICPPTGKGVKLLSDDLFPTSPSPHSSSPSPHPPTRHSREGGNPVWHACEAHKSKGFGVLRTPFSLDPRLRGDDAHENKARSTSAQPTEIDFENEGGETYICGNPPYQGSVNQTSEQKQDMARIFLPLLKRYKDLDYVAAFLVKAAAFNAATRAASAFVTTNSVTQGEQVAMLWPLIFSERNEIHFAHTSFPWNNLASHNATVTCVIVGLTCEPNGGRRKLFDEDIVKIVSNISPYLIATDSVIVKKRSRSISGLAQMQSGNKATDNGNLIFTSAERKASIRQNPDLLHLFKHFVGSKELINGGGRWCIWIENKDQQRVQQVPELNTRIGNVRQFRRRSKGKQANDNAGTPHRFVFAPHSDAPAIAVPNTSSERRQYLPCALTNCDTVVSNLASVIYDAPLWNLALIASRLHLVWIATVCGKLETRYRYSNTLGWNTFPVPTLTEQMQADLTRCAEDILLAREHYFPATIADMYDPKRMDKDFSDVRRAHQRNDEVIERIYIGRRFKNDTERLEKLFAMYTDMTAVEPGPALADR